MALDLRKVQEKVAGIILVDTCDIYRDPEGSSDDVMDADTFTFAATDDVKIHVAKACNVKWQLRGGYVGEGGQPLVVSEYEVSFKQPFTDIKVGDRLKMLTCVHDPRLVGKNLFVKEVLHGSLEVFKRVRTIMREEGVEQP